MPWQHAIAGGQGNLVAGSFQSPDFLTGVRGWQMTRAGHLEANDAVIRRSVTVGEVELGANGLVYSATGFGANPADALNGLVSIQDIPSAAQAPMLVFFWQDQTQLTAGGFYVNPVTGQLVLWPGTVITPADPASPTGWTLPESWHVIGQPGQPAFGAGFGAPGAGDQAARFTLGNDGTVMLDGVVVTTAATAANATLFTLPLAAYIPLKRKRLAGVTSASGYTTAGQTLVNVAPATGVVTCVPACSGAGQQIVLDGMTFKVN